MENMITRDANQIFACALVALSSCITRFDKYSIRDLYERTYQAELYAELRNRFGHDHVEFEAPYPKSTKLCDICVYGLSAGDYWVEMKYWSNNTAQVKADVSKLRELQTDQNKILLTYWYEEKRVITEHNLDYWMGNKDLSPQIKHVWFAVLPAPDSEEYQAAYAGCSMYIV